MKSRAKKANLLWPMNKVDFVLVLVLKMSAHRAIKNHPTKVQSRNNRYVRKCMHKFFFIYEHNHLNFFTLAVTMV